MRIILNADDFGMSAETVAATIDCFRAGGLTSATIMPKMPASDLAIEFARANPQFSFGVHLTFVCDTVEAPVSDPKNVPDLVGPDGKFLPSQRVRFLALRNRISVDQIEQEISAQIGSLIDSGVPVSHVDSHGHLHKFAPFVAALEKALPRFNISRVRSAQDIYLRKPLKSPTYWFGGVWRRRIMRKFKTTEHFFMPTNIDDARAMQSLLPRLSGESIEVGGHPGSVEDWRIAEHAALNAFGAAARSAGHQIINWNDL